MRIGLNIEKIFGMGMKFIKFSAIVSIQCEKYGERSESTKAA